MKYPIILLCLVLMQSALGMSTEEARHLQRRTGFHVDSKLTKKFESMTREQAVDFLMSRTRTTPLTPQPKWIEHFEYIYDAAIRMKKGQGQKADIKKIKQRTEQIIALFPNIPKPLVSKLRTAMDDEKKIRRVLNMISNRLLSKSLQAWWLEEMHKTESPLTERMTLFWHNHFATSFKKVKVLPWMYSQNLLLRRHAFGSFKDLLRDVSKDAAMLFYLDSNKNVKGAPNENFAREVMELFTLGEGNYSEKDIKEAARAFTGWNVDRLTGDYVFRHKQHDEGNKTILGQTGKFYGDDVLNIILQNKKTAEFITKKIWKEFVSPELNEAKINAIATTFFESGYEIKTLMREVFISDEFYKSSGQLIKSPVDLLVGTIKEFDIEPVNYLPYAMMAGRLGMELFDPPNVKGWPGGEKWINTSTLLIRKDLMTRLFRVGEKKEKANMMNPMQAMASMSTLDMKAVMKDRTRSQMLEEVLVLKPVSEIEDKKKDIAWARQIVLDPVYQLR
ncbi:MAG: DUF1800 domain-containing protein [Deltaproteobacteria bacterium]|nr:MAG: DUF1800 domain-containing protein [Deltaproteobacteria bacterium]